MFIVPTILSAIGGGLGILGNFEAADQMRQTADLNYQVALGNAQTNRDASLTAIRIGNIRNRIEADAARTNIRLSLADAEARERNAQRLQAFAEVRTTQGRETIRRARRNFEELRGRQMSAIASSGVTASGSPLEVMAESARQAATSLADLWDETTMERADLQDRAAMERFGGAQTRIGAMAERSMISRTRNLNRTASRLATMQAHSEFRSALFGATADRASAYDAARASSMSGVGRIFAGAGNLYSQLRTGNRLGA